jgi:hypothetical protein
MFISSCSGPGSKINQGKSFFNFSARLYGTPSHITGNHFRFPDAIPKTIMENNYIPYLHELYF